MKPGSARRERLKRAREWVYLTHFLATQGIKPERIISGKDDGQEPDFTCIIDGRLVGIELTTLPRLRDNLGDKYLRLKRLYWRLRAYLVPVGLRIKPKQLRRLSRLQFREDFFNKPLKPTQRRALEKLEPKLIAPVKLGLSLGLMTAFGLRKRKLRQFRVFSSDASSTQSSKSSQAAMSATSSGSTKSKIQKNSKDTLLGEVSFISQHDMDAVMEKKAHKAEGYHRRRELDELWLLVHANFYQQENCLYFPKSSISHDSDYEQVWLTSYPLVHAYPVQEKRFKQAV